MSTSPISNFRIAPTPSGFLHLGNAFNFLLVEALARKGAGQVRLRIDDLDFQRSRPAYVQAIFDDLHWLGVSWGLGPQDSQEQKQQYSQVLRIPSYELLIQTLIATGRVFACTCSRQQIAAARTDGQYSGTCLLKQLPLDTPGAALRIRTPEEPITFQDYLLGPVSISLDDASRHFIIRRRDGLPAYHIASLSDDVDYKTTHVVRGEDLLGSTAAQLFLARLLRLDAFLNTTFYHHPLLSGRDGSKLSKSAGAQSLQALRSSGADALQVRTLFREWLQEHNLKI